MSFAGLCIGGPLAGKMHESAIRQFTTQNAPLTGSHLEVSHSMDQALRASDIETTRYEWSYIDTSHARFGLWLPNGMSMEEALNTMAAGYTRSVN